MNNTKTNFSVQDGIRTQQEYLNRWKQILQTSAYQKLAGQCLHKNKLLPSTATGYDVFRGQDLDTYITNEILPKY